MIGLNLTLKMSLSRSDKSEIYIDDNITLGHNLLSITTPSDPTLENNRGNILRDNGEILIT